MFEWMKRLFSKPKEEPKLQIWCILHGPISVDDMPEEEIPEGATDRSAYMVLKIAADDRVFDAEFWFDDMDDAYEIVKHFSTNIEPLTLNTKEYEHVR
jgi:hypothetical protein